MYRLYIDETGDHCFHNSKYTEISKKYLCLIGVMMKRETNLAFHDSLDQLKRKFLHYDVDDPPILHREDMVNKRNAFRVFQDASIRENWDKDLLKLIESTDFKVIAVLIDKDSHGLKKHRRRSHPYHYGLEALLERYCSTLLEDHAKGDVMAESRGGKEDNLLKEEYSKIYKFGSHFNSGLKCRANLSSKELKLKPKLKNIAGLQLADLLAHPLARDVLQAYGRIESRGSIFADRLCEVINPKYRRGKHGRINGYGRKILS